MRDLDVVRKDLIRGLKALNKAVPDYDYADAYYAGDDPELYLSDALRLYLRDSVNAFRLNMASVAVDAVVDRLFIANFTSPNARTQKEIDRIVAENDIWAWSNDAIRESEKLGDEYIGVWEGPDGRPVLSPLDPRSTRVIYDSELERIPVYMVRQWVENEGDQDEEYDRATISYADEIYKFYKDTSLGDWKPFEIPGEPWPLPNILDDLPVGHLRNGFPYGSPGHKKSYGMQQVITKAVLNMVANIDFMGFRQRYALKDPDKSVGIPVPSPRTQGGEPVPSTSVRPALSSGPGKLWQIVAESVGEFSPTQAQEFIDLINACIINMARAERLPVRKYGADGSGQQPSGDSQREDDRIFQDRVNARKRSNQSGLIAAMRKALIIAGISDPIVELEWTREEIQTDKNEYDVATVGAALIAQVLTEPALRPYVVQKFQEWGYSMEEIDQFIPENVEPVVAPVATVNPGELDSANPEIGAIPND